MTETLTPEELETYTGYKQSAKQSEWLSENGILHRRRNNGTIAVTWTQINNPPVMSGSQPRWERA